MLTLGRGRLVHPRRLWILVACGLIVVVAIFYLGERIVHEDRGGDSLSLRVNVVLMRGQTTQLRAKALVIKLFASKPLITSAVMWLVTS